MVASEVRALAAQRPGGKKSRGLIDDSVQKVSIGSDQVEAAGATMQEIVASVRRRSIINENLQRVRGSGRAASSRSTRPSRRWTA